VEIIGNLKAGITALLYLSISWVLTISYQLLTETAVTTIAVGIASIWPAASVWLSANIETIAFVYAFTWIFVLSSVIPSVIVGKERGFISQYIVVLVLSLLAFFMPDILLGVTGVNFSEMVGNLGILQNPIIAVVYLSVPYMFMLGIDWRSKANVRRAKQEKFVTDYVNVTRNSTFKMSAEKEAMHRSDSTQEEQ
jgi:uncharacterized membrane protein YqaE (UPF0057 family)